MYVTCKYTATVYSVYLYCVLLRLQRFLCPIVTLSFLPLVPGEKETNWQMEKPTLLQSGSNFTTLSTLLQQPKCLEKSSEIKLHYSCMDGCHSALNFGHWNPVCTMCTGGTVSSLCTDKLSDLARGLEGRILQGGKWKGSAESKFSLRGPEIPQEAKTKWENRDEQKSFGEKKMRQMGRVKTILNFFWEEGVEFEAV